MLYISDIQCKRLEYTHCFIQVYKVDVGITVLTLTVEMLVYVKYSSFLGILIDLEFGTSQQRQQRAMRNIEVYISIQ